MRKSAQKIGRLYFRFIVDTDLERAKITALQVAKQLETWGFIRLEDNESFTYLKKFNTVETEARLIEALLKRPGNNPGPKSFLTAILGAITKV